MKRTVLFLAVAAFALMACGPALAVGLDIPLDLMGAGPAVVVPFGDEPAIGAMDITIKLLPVVPPEKVDLGDPLSLVEYCGANLGGDILIHGLNGDELDGGLSLPIYSTSGTLPMRAGATYVKGIGGAWFVKWDVLPCSPVTAPTALDGTIPVQRDQWLSFGVLPGGFEARYTILLD